MGRAPRSRPRAPLLVPALMVKMGSVNWYLPRPIDRGLPHISIEGAEFFRARERRPAVEVDREHEPVAGVASS
jgi:putative drug exporter of the RND superfamily